MFAAQFLSISMDTRKSRLYNIPIVLLIFQFINMKGSTNKLYWDTSGYNGQEPVSCSFVL